MKRLINKLKNRLRFEKEFKTFSKLSQNGDQRFSLNKNEVLRCMNDNTPSTGFDRHYVYHTSWAVRKVLASKAERHVDIASTLFFCGTLSASMEVEFYDYRPANLQLSNLKSLPIDLLNLDWEDNSIQSLSCMHTIEHVGLGRYGDPFDYNGDLKAIQELVRVLAKGGKLYFVVPIGSVARIQFNAHRIYTKEMVINQFESLGLTLNEFTLIPEDENDGGLVQNPSAELLAKQNYGCGCFIFEKP